MKININLIFLSILIFSCQEKKPLATYLKFNNVPVINFNSTWGVVDSEYARISDDMSIKSSILLLLSRGDVVEIIEKNLNSTILYGEQNFWYRVKIGESEGWIFGSYLKIFDYKSRADNYSQYVLEKSNE